MDGVLNTAILITDLIGRGFELRVADGKLLIRPGDQLTAGDYGTALASYRQLASKHPDQTAYAQVARILARDLARRCHAARGAEEAACTP